MKYPRRESDVSDSAVLIAGTSAPMRALASAIYPVAASDVNILVHGESGTGKRVVAQAIHRQSPRRNAPFFAIAFPDRTAADIEQELFGVRGAADLLWTARAATLYLDEIASLPLPLQRRLLRALRVADTRGAVRIIASTASDLSELMRAGRFLTELYRRLAPICLTIPPLRDRRRDVRVIATQYVRTWHQTGGVEPVTLERGALAELGAYSWPGNARELYETLTAALAQRHRTTISAARIRAVIGRRPYRYAAPNIVSLREFECEYIISVLGRCNGNKTLAARRLGIGRNTLLRTMKAFGLGPRVCEGRGPPRVAGRPARKVPAGGDRGSHARSDCSESSTARLQA